MKNLGRVLLVIYWLGSGFTTSAQVFLNLDFENASTNTIKLMGNPPYGTGPTRDLLPGWQLSLGGFPLSSIGFNVGGSDPEFVGKAGLYERVVLEAWYPWIADIPPPDNGKYILIFDHGDGFPSYEIVQRGDVPADARVLRINGYHLSGSGYFTASMDGVPIIGGDISAFAGKNVELKITSQWPIPTNPLEVPAGTPIAFLDSIAFFGVSDLGLQISRSPAANNGSSQVTIRFNVNLGQDYFVEYRDSIDPQYSWQTFPGGPHNSGSVIDPAGNSQRFYRLRSVPN